jgi:hypothetical protein
VTVDELRDVTPEYPSYFERRYLQLPESVTDRSRKLAHEIVEEAGATTVIDQALVIQDYLRDNYEYLLERNVAPGDQDVVDYFLFENKVGRCDHFASSMAVLLRELGIPSRIVTGFAPVPYDDVAGGFLYRGRNAHSWVEVYFPGYGWLPFEPTPSQSVFDLSGPSAERGQPAPEEEVRTPVPEEPSEPLVSTPEATPLPAPAATVDDDLSGSAGYTDLWPLALAALAVIGALALGAGTAAWSFGLRGLAPGASYFTRLLRAGRFWGVDQSPDMTPREFAAVYGHANPPSARAAVAVADAYARELYGGPVDSAGVEQQAAAAWREVKHGLLAWRPWNRWLKRGS